MGPRLKDVEDKAWTAFAANGKVTASMGPRLKDVEDQLNFLVNCVKN